MACKNVALPVSMAMIAPHVAIFSKSEILPRQYQFIFNLAFMLSSFMLLSSRALGVMVSQFKNDSIVPDTSYMALFVSLTPLSNHMAKIDKPVACIIKLHVHLGFELAGSAMAFAWLK
jgi:hypothetical protein